MSDDFLKDKQPDGTDNETEDEVSEVKLSKKQSGFVVMFLLVVILIVIIVLRSCTITKKVKNTENVQSVITETESVSQNTTEYVETESEFLENSSENLESDSAWSTETVESENMVQNVRETESKEETVKETELQMQQSALISYTIGGEEGILQEVSEPVLSEVMEASAMVASKTTYKVNSESYAYSINLVLLKGTDDYVSVKYFCPRKTYDALSEGETVTVSYQLDSNGVISISSVSR